MIVIRQHHRGRTPCSATALGARAIRRGSSAGGAAPSTRRPLVSDARDNPTQTAPPLLPRVAAGDESAVREVIREYGGLVWSLARRLGGNPSEAEEAVQEIFIDIWKSADRFDESIAAERTFIAMIARRRLIDRRRKASRRPTLTAQVEAPAADDPPLGADIELSEEARQAAAAFERLRPEQRQVLHMAIWRSMTHEQIAAATGMPLGTVKTHARRGLIRVREILAEARKTESASKGAST